MLCVVCYVGNPESTGDLSSVHLIFPLRSRTLWLCVQPPQEELPKAVHDGTGRILQCVSHDCDLTAMM